MSPTSVVFSPTHASVGNKLKDDIKLRFYFTIAFNGSRLDPSGEIFFQFFFFGYLAPFCGRRRTIEKKENTKTQTNDVDVALSSRVSHWSDHRRRRTIPLEHATKLFCAPFSRIPAGLTRVEKGFSGLYLVLLGFTGFDWILLAFYLFSWVLPSFTGFHWVLLDFTGFYWILLGLTGFNWV